MKKRTISKLKSLFGSKKGKRQQQEAKSRSPSPAPPKEPAGDARPLIRTPPPTRAGPPPSPPVPTHPIAPVPPEPPGPVPLHPCPVCNRTFVPQSLAKHVKICEKMTVKKRKTFDSSRQRREGTDLDQFLPKNFGLPENSPFLEKSPPNTAKTLPKPKPTSVKNAMKGIKPAAELQRCPHCNRTFGVRAFERHVEWCADKAKILPAAPAQPPPHIADAKQRLNARTQYKAPLVRTRRSSQSREKSSNSRSASVDSSRGVSPPPPREYGDYGTMRDKQGRSRASESVSSNDHEDMSPHVPVIRNSRNSTSQAGDSNPAVKARQARLARDLSSTRISQESSKPLQQSATDPKINKNDTQPKKHESQTRKILNKKQQQLKKLEEIAHKYNERQTQRQKELAVVAADRQKKIEKEKKRRKEILKQESENKKCLDKSQIPVPKIPPNKKETREESIKDEVKVSSPSMPSTSKGTTGVAVHAAKENTNVGEKHVASKAMKRNTMKVRESSMSLDSLEDGNKDPNHQTIGTNTELHCPCVPCIIHENVEQKVPVKKKSLSDITDRPISSNKSVDDNTAEPTVELLFKNLAIVSSCDIQARDPGPESKESILSGLEPSITAEKDYSKGDEPPAEIVQNKQTVSKINDKSKVNKDSKPKRVEVAQPRELSNEEFEDEYEHDMSGDFEDSIEASKCESLDNVNLGLLRHGSGDTYTKFTENPDDLEEFINLTDKMISTHNYNEIVFDMDKEMEEIHTPKTSSIEAIAKNTSDNDNSEGSSDIKSSFSETLQDLKIDLQKLLDNAGDAVYDKINEERLRDRTVSDMEHITVYQLNIGDKEKKYEIMDTITEVNYSSSLSNSLVEDKDVEFKLPSIAENNRSTGSGSCTKEKAKNIYISNQKYKMLGQQSRNNKDNQTFVKEQDDSSDADWSISADAPPLKLPRIEDKRLDDSYDPFLSAARQMKELMSSDTNIPKSVQKSCKDHNRTLPNIRPAKEKPSIPYLTTSNPKIMKDSLNKTYQKTPTLQRMKSFDNTNNNQKSISTFGSRCSSFRLNRNDKQKSSQKLNTTFTKSSKENISTTDKNFLNRSNTLNRSFSSYHTSAYSTPKPKDKIPKIATSYHSFQRTTIKQPVKLDKIKRDDNNKKDFVNLDSILADDNSSMTDSNYIDPRLINENDNLPINVNTILNNPDIISSMESLLTSEHLPAKFESFSANLQNNNINNNNNRDSNTKLDKIETNNNFNSKISSPAVVDDLSTQYDKIMSSLEQSMTSKASIRDDDSLCEDFDLEEFMTSFDEEIHKHKESKRTCSSTTRILRQQTHVIDSNKNSELDSLNSSPKILNGSNDLNPVNKSNSFNFSSNNVLSENLFPSSVKRASSLLDSIQKKGLPRVDTGKSRHKADQLEQDIMQSLKEFDNFYESERVDNVQSKKEINYSHSHNGTTKRESRVKSEKQAPKSENVQNGNYTPNGKSADSAYSSLNRISPSKLSVCNSKESNGLSPLDQIAGSDSSGCQKDETRSDSSEEFLAMERSAELDEPIPPAEVFTPIKEMENPLFNEKRAHSRTSSRRSPACWARPALSSSGSEASLQPAGARRQPPAPAPAPAPRLSRFCHECGCKFPVDSAKFCTECGVKRLVV